MNYEEAVAYIDETPKFTKKNSLDHTKECLRRLGNPQDKFKVIHVAGTNGKGSTCAFLTSVLREMEGILRARNSDYCAGRAGIFLRIIYFSSSGGDQ